MIHRPHHPSTILSKDEQKVLSEIKSRFISLAIRIMDTHALPIDLYEIYPESSELSVLLEQLNDLQLCLDSFRPFNSAQLAKLQVASDTEYTYESNRIEGNTLTLMETDLVICQGLTIEYIREVAQSSRILDEQTLLHIHGLILQGIDRVNAGSYRRANVRISGSRHVCPAYEKVPDKMVAYFQWYAANKDTLHPVELAAQMHQRLVSIYPFIESNGRTSCLVMSLILLQQGYPY